MSVSLCKLWGPSPTWPLSFSGLTNIAVQNMYFTIWLALNLYMRANTQPYTTWSSVPPRSRTILKAKLDTEGVFTPTTTETYGSVCKGVSLYCKAPHNSVRDQEAIKAPWTFGVHFISQVSKNNTGNPVDNCLRHSRPPRFALNYRMLGYKVHFRYVKRCRQIRSN